MFLEFLLISFFLNLIIFSNIKVFSNFLNLYDKPDKLRKIHKTDIPNVGGLFFFINLFLILMFFFFKKNFFYYLKFEEFFNIFIFCLIIFSIGFMDDKIDLKPSIKLFLTFVSVLLFLIINEEYVIKILKFSFMNYSINLELPLSYLVTCFFILLFINAFNMLDGINGLAILYFFLVSFFSSFYINNFLIVLIVFQFVFFFLINNFKNKIFLGNNGSMLLAFFLCIIFIKYYNLELIFYSDQIFIFMMMPGFDLLRLAVVRTLNNRHPFSPDTNHLHHLLLFSHGHLITICWIFFLITVPIIIFFLLNNSIASVLSGLLLYTCTILFCKKKLS